MTNDEGQEHSSFVRLSSLVFRLFYPACVKGDVADHCTLGTHFDFDLTRRCDITTLGGERVRRRHCR